MLEPICLPLKAFLQIETCPAEWKKHNLYLVRDEGVTFYVGQSYCAFDRVWKHFYDGFKWRSEVGRFILCNWRASAEFTVELLSSRHPLFAARASDRFAAERLLIEELQPCFNVTYNPAPHPLPAGYRPPGVKLPFRRTPHSLIREAALMLKAEDREDWLEGA